MPGLAPICVFFGPEVSSDNGGGAPRLAFPEVIAFMPPISGGVARVASVLMRRGVPITLQVSPRLPRASIVARAKRLQSALG